MAGSFVQLSVAGSYRLATLSVPTPPKMIISLPVHTAVWP